MAPVEPSQSSPIRRLNRAKPGTQPTRRKRHELARRGGERDWPQSPHAEVLVAGRLLTFSQAEGDEAVGGVVGREADLDAVARNHPDAETAHTPRELRSHRLP